MAAMRKACVFILLGLAPLCYLLAVSEVPSSGESLHITRRLQATIQGAVPHLRPKWGAKQTAALILSVVVSLTSSLDRECGASLYIVLFAVLLNMSFRRAAAMTAFTVALGALAPGIASMSEGRLTERDVLPIADYPGALVLLPTMFWGISFGVIVNLWFPNWLLALMWVVAMTASNIELVVSFCRYLTLKREAKTLVHQLRNLPGPRSGEEDAASAALRELSGEAVAAAYTQQQQQQHANGNGMLNSDAVQQQKTLLDRAQQLVQRAHRIEALALLYPTLYIRDVNQTLQRAKFDTQPCVLRSTATASCIGRMDSEQQRLNSELRSFQQVFGRFTFSWRKWWQLNRFHFEMSLVLKVVVLHLVTEAVRHKLSKACSTRFWAMLVGMTGAVTAFLLFTLTCYTGRRLWRGPHWVDALNQVRAVKKQQQQQELQELQALVRKDTSSGEDDVKAVDITGQTTSCMTKDVSAAAAAVAAGEAVAVDLPTKRSSSSSHAAAVISDGSLTAGSKQQQATGKPEEPQMTRWQRFKKRTPWVWVPAPDAITNISYCNSFNQYQNWRVPLIMLLATVTLPIGIFGCALGLPGGPVMAQMLLMLGLKPEVVAGTSRFLVLCFTFGSFVAHIIAGSLEPTLAAAFGLLNLALAPLGMFLITKFQPKGVYVIGLSLFMGVLGVVVVVVWQLVPLMAALVGPDRAMHTGRGGTIAASLQEAGNHFDLNRFCHAH